MKRIEENLNQFPRPHRHNHRVVLSSPLVDPPSSPLGPVLQSLIAQDSSFPLRKPAAFHWDFFLLGISTFIAGLLGVPAPNGLIPQAPMHTASLVVMERKGKGDKVDKSESGQVDSDSRDDYKEVPVSVVEQRVSNLVQGSLCE